MENEEKSEPVAEELQEFKGKNLEDAIGHAEHKLKIPRSEFNYEIVTEKTKLFGISKEIVIHAWPKLEAGDNAITAFLEKLMKVFPLELDLRDQNEERLRLRHFRRRGQTAPSVEGRRPAPGPAARPQQDLQPEGPGRLRVLPEEKRKEAPRIRPGYRPAGPSNRDRTKSSIS